MAMVACPECGHIFRAPNHGPFYCELCSWDGRWKQETAPEDEVTKEIEHPALRGCH